MIAKEVANLLESGCSTIIGTVDGDGVPEADRGWGQWTLREPERLRFLVSADATRTIANLRDGGRVAFTATVIETHQSVQLKGRTLVVEAPTVDDLMLGEQYRAAFFRSVHEADGTALSLVEALAPDAFMAVECTVEAIFDQTPGPTAGQCLS